MTEEWQPGDLERVPSCPLCGSGDRRPLHVGLRDLVTGVVPGSWDLHTCARCGAAYLDPRPTQHSIGKAYAAYYTHATTDTLDGAPAGIAGKLRRAAANGYINHSMGTDLRPAAPRLGQLVAAVSPWRKRLIRGRTRSTPPPPRRGESRLLDVGCGNGGFLALAARAGWQPYGVEPDPQAARCAREAGVTMLGALLSDVDPSHAGSFDRITLSHVIEHVHDPIDMLRRCRRLLSAQGRLWIDTPNLDAVGHARYGRHWRGLEPPRHLVLFTRDTLVAALHRAGYEHVEWLDPFPAWEQTFAASEDISANRVVSQGVRPQGAELRQAVAQARREVAADASKSEFLTALAW